METTKTIKPAPFSPLKADKNKRAVDITGLCTRSGLTAALGLICFFLLMGMLDLYEFIELRMFNALFLLAAITYTLYSYAKTFPDHHFNYFTGLRMGLHTTLVAVIPFIIFIFVYLTSNPAFMQAVKSKIGAGEFISPALITGALFIEGISSGLIITFICMQYFKK